MSQVKQLIDLYRDFTKRAFQSRADVSEQDALAWMILLHTHRIQLLEPIVEESPGVTVLPALTKRTAAEAITSLWAEQGGARSEYQYWYNRYEVETPFEFVEQATSDYVPRLERMRAQLAADPRVRAVVAEE